jgi:hypothetical protein
MTTNYPPSGIGLKDSDRLLTKVGTSGMPTSNWFNFKPRLLNLADLYDLLAIFETGITITTTTEDEKARTAQLAKDKLARHLLMNSICDGGPLDLIKGCTTARDMWLKLIARFEVNTLAHCNARWKEDSKAARQCDKHSTICDGWWSLNKQLLTTMLVSY